MEPEGGFPTNTGKNPVDLDETVSLTSKCVALPFELVIMHGRTQQTMMTDHQLNIMTQPNIRTIWQPYRTEFILHERTLT